MFLSPSRILIITNLEMSNNSSVKHPSLSSEPSFEPLKQTNPALHGQPHFQQMRITPPQQLPPISVTPLLPIPSSVRVQSRSPFQSLTNFFFGSCSQCSGVSEDKQNEIEQQKMSPASPAVQAPVSSEGKKEAASGVPETKPLFMVREINVLHLFDEEKEKKCEMIWKNERKRSLKKPSKSFKQIYEELGGFHTEVFEKNVQSMFR